MSYKPFRDGRYSATPAIPAISATIRRSIVAEIAEIAGIATEQPSQSQDFEERAAICEFDGGLPRDHAEQLAALHAMPLPAGITGEQCAVVIDAAARFLDRKRLP